MGDEKRKPDMGEKRPDDLVKVTLEYGDGKTEEIAGPFEYARIVLEQEEKKDGAGTKSTRRFEVTRIAAPPPRSRLRTELATGGIESIDQRIEDAFRGWPFDSH